MLIHFGANPEAKMPSGETIMEYAHKTGKQRLLQILSRKRK